MDRERSRENYKGGTRKLLGGDGCIHYPDCGDGFKVVYMTKFIKFYTLIMCSLYVKYISIELFPQNREILTVDAW